MNKQELLGGSTKPEFDDARPERRLHEHRARAVALADCDGVRRLGERAVVARRPSLRRERDPARAGELRRDRDAVDPRLSRPPFAAQPPNASGQAQPGIDTNDDRVLQSVWENGRLWFTANTACQPAGDSLLRACARVTELATATGTVTMDNNLSQPGAHLFYPAIQPDGTGNLVIVFGESGVACGRRSWPSGGRRTGRSRIRW